MPWESYVVLLWPVPCSRTLQHTIVCVNMACRSRGHSAGANSCHRPGCIPCRLDDCLSLTPTLSDHPTFGCQIVDCFRLLCRNTYQNAHMLPRSGLLL
ncbi:hypothetical protein JB92DRAFT_1600513 [Gautieria morchelliformis]|nr:hypothetical protein JB92DRAFT_1600513 [Gautieria morchelliformis]